LRIDSVSIKNYRGIRECEVSLSNFVCIVGENNAGKSTILLALSLFFTGNKLSVSEYYDKNEEILITLSFKNIEDSEFERIQNAENRAKVKELVQNGEITLTRRYDLDGNSDLLHRRLVPKDVRFQQAIEQLKGKRGAEIESILIEVLPEYSEKFQGIKMQGSAKEVIKDIISNLSIDQFDEQDVELAPNVQTSLKIILPETIFIPAVTDITDEVKTKESATFGKLIGILLKDIEHAPEVKSIISSFNNLNLLLNRSQDETGKIIDNRIVQIKEIEGIINTNLRDGFPNVTLDIEIPPPELKQIFSSAKVFLDDGVKNSVESKGDGLKRSVTFALLRSYVQLKRTQEHVDSEEESRPERPYLFLFEEPELFLHPAAQRILFDSLKALSEDNQVVVTTHSPLFFSPNSTGTFIKVSKLQEAGQKPYGYVRYLDFLKDISAKDAFQLLCYENNSAALFAKKVLLVEGDSDFIYLKHIAKILNEKWDFEACNIPIVRISGKSNVKRFKQFFEKFGVEVHTLLDLDAIISGFELLGVEESIIQKRIAFLEVVDGLAETMGVSGDLSRHKIKELLRRYSFKQKYDRLKELAVQVAAGNQVTQENVMEIELLFSEETDAARKEVLNRELDIEYKDELLRDLRRRHVYILSKGVIEDYYPQGVLGEDKPSKALNACKLVREYADIQKLCPKVFENNIELLEFEDIFCRIFGFR
jgi:putative ATP-dependent endonuclease of the OLD family